MITNPLASKARLGLSQSQSDLATAVRRISSGLRINGAKDDAAGLAIADRLQTTMRGSRVAQRNINDGVSLVQVADGALGSISTNLQRLRELAVQSANATNSGADRAALQLEAAQLLGEIDRVATQTAFNGTNLLDGSFAVKTFQVGAGHGQRVTLPSFADFHTTTLGTWTGFTVSPQSISVGSGSPANHFRDVTATVNGVTYVVPGVDADPILVAAAFNSEAIPGFTATPNPTRLRGTSTANASASGAGTFTLNGVPIRLEGLAGAGNLAANRATAVAALNAVSAATGAVAVDTGTGIELQTQDGREMITSYNGGSFTGSARTDFGIGSSYTTSISLRYEAPPGTGGTVTYGQDTLWSASQPIQAMGSTIAGLDLSSAAGSTAALDSLDMALSRVNRTRAELGAVQNRLVAAMQNASIADENLAASRGRIVDADIAVEMATLSRAEILQQAGTALLAQANQLPRETVGLLIANAGPR